MFILPRLFPQITQPFGLREIKRFVRDLRRYTTLSFRPKVLVNGQVILADLAALHPPHRHLAKWTKEQIDRADKAQRQLHEQSDETPFFDQCVAKQVASTSARKRGERQASAPLAGIVLGKAQYPALYRAFFDAVKAEALALTQTRYLRDGLPIAGVMSGDKVGLTEADFIDPYTVTTGQGNDCDLRAEAALLSLSRSTMELSRVFDAEEVKSKNEEGMEEAQQFAHSEYQVLSDELLDEVMEKQGIFIPRDADSRNARALAEGITDQYLYSRVIEALEKGDAVSDVSRIYLHRDGTPAFRTKKAAPAAKWKPFEPTPVDVLNPDFEETENPLAGYSAFSSGLDAPSHPRSAQQLRQVSQETFDAMHRRLAQLRMKADTIAEQLSVALGDGDLSESAAYDEARNAMFANQKATADLERELASVEVGDVAATNVGKFLRISIDGTTKTVRLTDAEPQIGEVSVMSPLGKDLLYAKAGAAYQVEQTVTRRIATKLPQLSVAGRFRTRLARPAGVQPPALPDVLTQYSVAEVVGKRDGFHAEIHTIQVLSIHLRRPWPKQLSSV